MDDVKVECVVDNVWTSKKELFKGDQDVVSKQEADFLVKRKQVKKVK